MLPCQKGNVSAQNVWRNSSAAPLQLWIVFSHPTKPHIYIICQAQIIFRQISFKSFSFVSKCKLPNCLVITLSGHFTSECVPCMTLTNALQGDGSLGEMLSRHERLLRLPLLMLTALLSSRTPFPPRKRLSTPHTILVKVNLLPLHTFSDLSSTATAATKWNFGTAPAKLGSIFMP